MSSTTPPISSESSSVAARIFCRSVRRRVISMSSFLSAALSAVAERIATRTRPSSSSSRVSYQRARSPRIASRSRSASSPIRLRTAGEELAHEALLILGPDRLADEHRRLPHRFLDHLGAQRRPGGGELVLGQQAGVGANAL